MAWWRPKERTRERMPGQAELTPRLHARVAQCLATGNSHGIAKSRPLIQAGSDKLSLRLNRENWRELWLSVYSILFTGKPNP